MYMDLWLMLCQMLRSWNSEYVKLNENYVQNIEKKRSIEPGIFVLFIQDSPPTLRESPWKALSREKQQVCLMLTLEFEFSQLLYMEFIYRSLLNQYIVLGWLNLEKQKQVLPNGIEFHWYQFNVFPKQKSNINFSCLV